MQSSSYTFDPYLNYGSIHNTTSQVPSVPVYFPQVAPQHVQYQPYMRYNAGSVSVPSVNNRTKRPAMDSASNSCDNGVKKKNALIRSWTPSEDRVLLHLVNQYGPKWAEIAYILKTDFNINRLGKQCRERWCNHVNPNIKHGEWTPEEDECILKWQSSMGNRWARIAKMLNGRTENSVKNRFVSLLSKGLKASMGGRGNLDKVRIANHWEVPLHAPKLESTTDSESLKFLDAGYKQENLQSPAFSETVSQLDGSTVMTMSVPSEDSAVNFFKNEHHHYGDEGTLSTRAVAHFNSNFSPYPSTKKDGYSFNPSISSVESLRETSSGPFLSSSIEQSYEMQTQSHYKNGHVDVNRGESSAMWDYLEGGKMERSFRDMIDSERWEKHLPGSAHTTSTKRSTDSEVSFVGFGPSSIHFQNAVIEPAVSVDNFFKHDTFHTLATSVNPTVENFSYQSSSHVSISNLEAKNDADLLQQDVQVPLLSRGGCGVTASLQTENTQETQFNEHNTYYAETRDSSSSAMLANPSNISVYSTSVSMGNSEVDCNKTSLEKSDNKIDTALNELERASPIEATTQYEEVKLREIANVEDVLNCEKSFSKVENLDPFCRDLLMNNVFHRYERPRRRYYTSPPVQSKFEAKT